MWEPVSKMVANDATFWSSHPYIILNAWMWAGFSDLTLENRIRQWWWDPVTKRTLASILGTFILALAPSFWVRATATLWAVRRGPPGRVWGRPPANTSKEMISSIKQPDTLNAASRETLTLANVYIISVAILIVGLIQLTSISIRTSERKQHSAGVWATPLVFCIGL